MQNKTVAPAIPTVLIVDDEEAIRIFQRRILEEDGYGVVEAADGAQGVALMAEQASLDLVIADLDMPVLGGDEMVRRIRSMRPDLRVLYVTGHIDGLMDTRPLWEGEAFLEKPFTAAGLREAVSLLLRGTIGRR